MLAGERTIDCSELEQYQARIDGCAWAEFQNVADCVLQACATEHAESASVVEESYGDGIEAMDSAVLAAEGECQQVVAMAEHAAWSVEASGQCAGEVANAAALVTEDMLFAAEAAVGDNAELCADPVVGPEATLIVSDLTEVLLECMSGVLEARDVCIADALRCAAEDVESAVEQESVSEPAPEVEATVNEESIVEQEPLIDWSVPEESVAPPAPESPPQPPTQPPSVVEPPIAESAVAEPVASVPAATQSSTPVEPAKPAIHVPSAGGWK